MQSAWRIAHSAESEEVRAKGIAQGAEPEELRGKAHGAEYRQKSQSARRIAQGAEKDIEKAKRNAEQQLWA